MTDIPHPSNGARGMSQVISPHPEPDAPVAPASRPRPFLTMATLIVGVAGLLCALAMPFAPVLVTQATVSWPSAGEDPRSTTAFFVPYEPAEMHLRVPCRVLRQRLDADERTIVFATGGVASVTAGRALVVETERGLLRIHLNGRLVTAVTPPPTGCDVRVDATADDTVVSVGSAPPIRLAGQVPQVHAFVTWLSPEQARGMTVTARARNWFEASPTGLKQALITGHVLLIAAALALLWRAGRRAVPATGRRARRPRRPRRTAAAIVAVDAAVVGVLGVWAVIGPMTADDGYAMMTIRNAVHSGDIGNYYHWYNASEAPFTLWQRIIGLIAPASLAPVWLRLPSVLAGALTWFLVHRGLVGGLLPRHGRRPSVALLTAVAFLAWWLPFGLGIRPEPLVALCVAATFAFLLRGTRSEAGAGGLPWLGSAALAAGLGLSVTPSGILVFAPVLVMLPRTWRTLRAGLPGGRGAQAALAGRVIALAATASAGITAMFWAQSLRGTLKATEVHNDIGPSHAWHEEVVRYGYLLGDGAMGNAAKRVAVLLTLALLVTMAALVARHARAISGLQLIHLPTAVVGAAFGLLCLTPSKWSHHFGALAGLGSAFVVVATVTVASVARRNTDRGTAAIAMAGGGLVALAAALAFAGPNRWWQWSDYQLPWAGERMTPLGLPLSNPLLWAAVAPAAAGVWAMRHRTADPRARGRAALTASPALLAVLTAAASVALMLVGFAMAPLRDPAAYTLGRQNVGHLVGSDCGLPDKVEVMPDVPGGVLAPVGGAKAQKAQPADRTGFAAQAGFPRPVSPTPPVGRGPHRFVWGSFLPGERGGDLVTGQFTSPWFRLPQPRSGQELALSVAGEVTGGNSLVLEFGRSGTDMPVATRTPLVPEGRQWRTAALPASAVPAGSDRVRVRAVDGSTGFGGWLAFSGPRIREVVRLSDFLPRRPGPQLVAWEMAFTTPCVTDFPVVAHGLAAAPTTLIQVPRALNAGIIFNARMGGSLYGARLTGRFSEVPSRLVGRPDEAWGRLVLIDYPFARDAYDVALRTVRLNGWEGDR